MAPLYVIMKSKGTLKLKGLKLESIGLNSIAKWEQIKQTVRIFVITKDLNVLDTLHLRGNTKHTKIV